MDVSRTICQAISGWRRLRFTYKDCVRIVDPYILGYGENGALILSAVQVSGGSGRGFRSFAVQDLEALAVIAEKFFGNHPDYNPRDRFFRRIVCQI
ncbi:hypothetical protein ASD44_16065 [Mesorhizobium sp. Root554]|uniref:hypothetical protein n=1 Tax=unclassified Mesorhizobium TaxID=325217 RepID=UPI0006F85523|nr:MULTISPECIES: hypothetical protein [unclassified Mesorhizobium]KQZ15405.1 hypothetical protein ASD27_16070 [Mesorhizobium sp. Root1471]KQZ37913.1 hypothetical protein ASD44_16065 [Mesorhizobium sp. Root554]